MDTRSAQQPDEDTQKLALAPLGSRNPQVTQRAIGAMVGSACGDALGAPFEFGAPGAYLERFPKPVLGGIGEMIGGGGANWAPGEFTDDTQMAVHLAESLLNKGGLDVADVHHRWTIWAETANDVGVTTRHALAGGLTDGARISHEVTAGRSASNGALMRVTPVALGYLGDEISCVDAAITQAAVTHFDPAAGWGAAVASVLIRRLILGETFESAIVAALGVLPADQWDVFAGLLDANWSPHKQKHPEMAEVSNGTVWVCLAQAVWAVRHAESFHDAVVSAIELGGDTDTVACVAGAIAGARWSIQRIPSRWATYVHGEIDNRRVDNRGLQDLALQLIGAQPPRLTAFGDKIGPTEITKGLWAADIQGATDTPDGFAVVSMAITRGLFDTHRVRREFHLIDQEEGANTDASSVLSDALDTIDALIAERHQVVVHCHAGRSRTGLVLKGWAMRHLGLDERQAHQWVSDRWPYCADWNSSFRRLLTEATGERMSEHTAKQLNEQLSEDKTEK